MRVWLPLMAAACLCCGRTAAQTSDASRPPILGEWKNGSYSNHVLGVELQLSSDCVLANEADSIAFSTQLPQRLRLAIQCGPAMYLLTSFPLHDDEPSDLKTAAEPSLAGAKDGGGYQGRGGWKKASVGKTPVLFHELSRSGHGNRESAFYFAMLIGRRYFAILANGPESAGSSLSQTLNNLKIQTSLPQ